MSRSRLVFAVPFLALALIGGGGAVATAAPTPASQADCDDVTHYSWSSKAAVQGIAFVGRITNSYLTDRGQRVFVFRVLSERVVPPGADGFRNKVRVALVDCVQTRFKVGGRYLVSGSLGGAHDGQVDQVAFVNDSQDAAAVAWRVWPNNRVKLMGYGPGTDWDDAPGYWTRPETLRQAVRAITPD